MSAPRIDPGIVGVTAGPLTATVDARWLMAYASALGETDARYYDTLGAGGPRAHPVFPVCYEWPAAVAIRAKTIGDDVARLGVHATHDLIVHRPPRAGDRLLTTARVADDVAHRAGTLVVLELSTVDAAGAPVTTTRYGSLHRGAILVDVRAVAAPPPRASAGAVRWEAPVAVAATAAHVYTECARIWNPIHTDVAVARAAGLPGIILHGTATLALAVSRIVARELGGAAESVRRLRVRFTGMVPMPSTFTVRAYERRGATMAFDAVGADGRSILSEGALDS